MRPLLTWLLAAGALLAESVGSASLTATPEEIVAELVIQTPADMTPEQAAALLAPLRIYEPVLESVGTLRDAPGGIAWQYTFIRPCSALYEVLRSVDYRRRQLQREGIPVMYQFFFRPSPKSVDAAKSRVLSELVREARRNAGLPGNSAQ